MVRASGPPFMLPDVRTDARAVTIRSRTISTAGIPHWMSTDEILEKVLADDFADVTFSGGDPMYQPEGFAELACAIKEKSGKNIWCYTGYTFETLLRNPLQAKLLQYIDVLVDGKFKQELRDESLCFRGSKNQRLIDVQASLRTEEVVAYNYNPVPRIA